MSVEQSPGPPGPGEVGFGGNEEDSEADAAEDVAEEAAEVAEEAAAAVVVLELGAEVELEPELEAAFGVDVELPHPAAKDTAASEAASAPPTRMPIGRLASEVFISSSMPWTAARAGTNPTTFRSRPCGSRR
ncbi:hypothetical protein [Catenulispora acidiphila]|uniref:hypothetical protein n=1 Tax=Catenulispora acidiphila TaxID=304895 RepID=UPI00019DF1B8|nr:hypothetical protein [Catenulispora acidiphila]